MDAETVRRKLLRPNQARAQRTAHVWNHGHHTIGQEIHCAYAGRNQPGARHPEAGTPRQRPDRPVRHPQVPQQHRPCPVLDVPEIRLPAAAELGRRAHHQMAPAPRHQPRHHQRCTPQPHQAPGQPLRPEHRAEREPAGRSGAGQRRGRQALRFLHRSPERARHQLHLGKDIGHLRTDTCTQLQGEFPRTHPPHVHTLPNGH